MHRLLTAVLPSLALAALAGLGTTAYEIGGYVSPGEQFAQQEKMFADVAAEQSAAAKALGCALPASSQASTGYAVRNVIDRKRLLDPAYTGSRNGVDNGDSVTPYRVPVDKAWELANDGRVAVIAGCADPA